MQRNPHQNQIAIRAKPANAARSLERDEARVAEIKAGLSRGEIARRMGITPKALSDLFTRDFPGDFPRWRFEAALDYRFAIWSPLRVLRLREGCLARRGFDPYLLARPELVTRARALGLPANVRDSLAKLRGLIMEYLAANPEKFFSPTPTDTHEKL